MGITVIDKTETCNIFPIPLSAQGSYDLDSQWTVKDRSQNARDLLALNGPVFSPDGVILNGVDQYLTTGILPNTFEVMSVSMWINLQDVNQNYLFQFNGGLNVTIAANTVTPSGAWSIPTVVVDNVQASFVQLNTLHHVVIVDQAKHTVNEFDLGRVDTDKFGVGTFSKCRVYDRILVLDDIEFLYDTEQ